MRQGFERGSEHMKNGEIRIHFKDCRGYFVGGLCFSSYEVPHFVETRFVVLDNLLRSSAMIAEHAAVRRKDFADFKILNFLLGLEKISQWILRPLKIHTYVRCDFWEQMVPYDHYATVGKV